MKVVHADAGDDELVLPLPAILIASLAIHAGAILFAPGGGKLEAPPALVSVVTIEARELEPPPPPPPPPSPTTEPEVAPSPRPLVAAARPAAAPKAAPADPSPAPVADVPVDLTSTVLSNDGPGIAVAARASGVPEGQGSGGGGNLLSAPPPPPAPAPSGPRLVAVGDLSRRPRPPSFDSALERNYPLEARRAGVSGQAILRLRILADGRVGRVEPISESFQGFARACEATVRSAPWGPPIDREGAAVATEITYTCVFEVRS